MRFKHTVNGQGVRCVEAQLAVSRAAADCSNDHLGGVTFRPAQGGAMHEWAGKVSYCLGTTIPTAL